MPRSKKPSSISSSTISTTSFRSVAQRPYKYSRKQKIVTTETPEVDNSLKSKRLESNNNLFKKPVLRSSLYSRRNFSKNVNVSSEVPKIIEIDRSDKSPSFKPKQILPRTSYYSRLKNKTESKNVTTDASIQATTEEIKIAEKKEENTAEISLIYTNSNSAAKIDEKNDKDNEHKNENQNFIITVNSKESLENSTANEIISKADENGTKPMNNIINTTQKYHATYKDTNKDISLQNREIITVTPPIRNIQTRKNGRKPSKRREEISIVTPKPTARSLRKYSDTFSKTTEPSSNGVSI